MSIKKGAVQAMAQQSKADRKNHLAQKRNAKRQALLRQKRGLDGLPPPPRVVGVISLAEEIPQLEDAMCRFLEQKANQVVVAVTTDDNSPRASVTCRFEAYKKQGNVTLLKCHQAFAPSGDDSSSTSEAVQAALDLARVCDLLLFVIDGNGPRDDDILTGRFIGGDDDNDTSNKNKTGQPQDWDHLISERGDAILSALKSQGLPTPLTVLAHTVKDSLLSGDDDDQDLMTMQSVKSIRRSKHKRQLDLKKYIGRFATTEFGSGNDKVVEVDLSSMMHNNTNDANMQDDPMDAPEPQDDNNKDDEEDPVQARKREALSEAFIRTLCSMSATPANRLGPTLSPIGFVTIPTRTNCSLRGSFGDRYRGMSMPWCTYPTLGRIPASAFKRKIPPWRMPTRRKPLVLWILPTRNPKFYFLTPNTANATKCLLHRMPWTENKT